MRARTALAVGLAVGAGFLASCGGASTPAAVRNPEVRQHDYRLYEIPGGKIIVCIGWGSSSSATDGGSSSSAITCDWDHPVDR